MIVHSSCGPKPPFSSDEFTACRSVTKPSGSSGECLATSHVKLYRSVDTCTGGVSLLMLSKSWTSFSISAKALPSAARKHTDPVPVGRKSVPASSVSAAPGSAKSSSRLACAGLVRPSSASKNPTRHLPSIGVSPIPLALLAELPGDLVQLCQPLLQGGVGREDRRQALARPDGRREVERVQRLSLAQILCRNAAHIARHLDQGAGQRCRSPGQQRARPVSRQLPVPRQQPDQQEADRVHDDAEQHDRDDQQL